MRRHLLVLIAGALLVAGTAAPLPQPTGENDAGSGQDAGDTVANALPIDEGSYQANLSWYPLRTSVVPLDLDFWDRYRLTPPPNSVINVRANVVPDHFDNGTIIEVNLEGPDGDVTDYIIPFQNGTQWTVEFSLIAIRGGDWNLSFIDFSDSHHRRTYNFTVEYERFDHGRVLHGEARQAVAWEVAFPEGVDGRLEHYRLPRLSWDGVGAERLYGVWYEPHPTECLAGEISTVLDVTQSSLGRTGQDGEDVLWTEGLPMDVTVGPPVEPLVQSPLRRDLFARRWWDTDNGNLTVDIGYAYNRGIDVPVAWMVWNGPVEPSVTDLGAESAFYTLEDFEAQDGGLGAQIGPATYARNLTLDFEVPEPPGNIVLVNGLRRSSGTNPSVPLALAKPRFTVELPNGTARVLHDDFHWWRSLDVLWRERTDRHVPAGLWSVHVDRVDGLEGNTIRVMHLNFGFDVGCTGTPV